MFWTENVIIIIKKIKVSLVSWQWSLLRRCDVKIKDEKIGKVVISLTWC